MRASGSRPGVRAALLSAVILTGGCNAGSDGTTRIASSTSVVATTLPPMFTMTFNDQRGDGRSVVIDNVVLTGNQGWVVVHTGGDDGALGPPIGTSGLLPVGTSTYVTVGLATPLASTVTVFAKLHVEDNATTTFDFPLADAPASAAGGGVLVFAARVEVVG